MASYDPDASPAPQKWLQADEDERIAWAAAYHRRHKVKLPNLQLHAAIHVAVENQIASGDDGEHARPSSSRKPESTRRSSCHRIGPYRAPQ